MGQTMTLNIGVRAGFYNQCVSEARTERQNTVCPAQRHSYWKMRVVTSQSNEYLNLILTFHHIPITQLRYKHRK